MKLELGEMSNFEDSWERQFRKDKYTNDIEYGKGLSLNILENKRILNLKIVNLVIIFAAPSFPFSFLVFPFLPYMEF